MKTNTTYSERLYGAMTACGIKTEELAETVGVTYHGVRKVLEGKSGSLNAANNARAAKALGIDGAWLATGEGEMRPAVDGWPFDFSRQEYDSLTDAQRHDIKTVTRGMVLGFVNQRKQASPADTQTFVKMSAGYTIWPLPIIKKHHDTPSHQQRSFFEAKAYG